MFVEPQACDITTVNLPDGSAFPLATLDKDGDKVWNWTLWDVIDVCSIAAVNVSAASSDSSSDSSDSDSDGDDFGGAPTVTADGLISLTGMLKLMKVNFVNMWQ